MPPGSVNFFDLKISNGKRCSKKVLLSLHTRYRELGSNEKAKAIAHPAKVFRSEVKGRKRVVLSLHKYLAPVKVAVFPLLTNRNEIVELAKKIAHDLKKDFVCIYDDTAAIGKLYRRQDEVGTPYCLTVDVQSLEDKKVTVRDRDTMQQERISIDRLREYFKDRLASC